uniref:Secreted protein n=1 Tax=Anguilla anguilla TaxID=7936 RepID=A0A0E9WN72_ANGAN
MWDVSFVLCWSGFSVACYLDESWKKKPCVTHPNVAVCNVELPFCTVKPFGLLGNEVLSED